MNLLRVRQSATFDSIINRDILPGLRLVRNRMHTIQRAISGLSKERSGAATLMTLRSFSRSLSALFDKITFAR